MRNIIPIAFATASLILSGCSQQKNTASLKEGSGVDYSISFFRNVIEVSSEGENVFVSPYSAGVALSMLAEGARGETLEELRSALNGVEFSAMELVPDSLVDVRSANAAWIRNGFDLKHQYLETLSGVYRAQVTNLDFAAAASVDTINSWCSEHTEGKITRIVDQISPDMMMFLMNALYFKAPWQKPFDKNATSNATFHGFSKDSKVPFMYRKDRFMYAEYSGNQLVRLPYEGGRYSMLVFLPAEDVSPDAVLPYLNEESYKKALDTMSGREVVLRMPKFRIEKTTMLNSAFSLMGAKRVFTPSAELGGISDGRISVDEVKQKCFVEVNEEGAEAAAVTSIGVRTTSVRVTPPPVMMTVDRPFLFAIADIENGNILFIGRVMNLQ